jgi:hypothetical protein
MDELKPQITQMLQSKMVNDYLEKLKSGAKIEVKEIQVSEAAKPAGTRQGQPSRKKKRRSNRALRLLPQVGRGFAWLSLQQRQQPRLVQHLHAQLPRLIQLGTGIATRDHVIGFLRHAARHLGAQRPQLVAA